MHKKQNLREHAPFGMALAKQVAAALCGGRSLGDIRHPYYCGVGFDCDRGEYRFFARWEGQFTPLLTFTRREKFEAWLAKQSEVSLAGSKEQNRSTVTMKQLEAFVRG